MLIKTACSRQHASPNEVYSQFAKWLEDKNESNNIALILATKMKRKKKTRWSRMEEKEWKRIKKEYDGMG